MNPESSTPAVETTAPAPQVDGATAQSASAESAEPKEPSLFDRLFRRDKPQAESQASTGKGQESKEQSAKPSTLTPEQEFERKVQAETDRREAKRAREQAEAEKLRLREEDPYAYVDQVKLEEQQREAEQRFTGFLGTVAKQFDEVLLDPLMERLPEAERQKLIGDEKLNAGTLDSRKALQNAALEVLVKQARAEGKAEAEAALRRNPAFRKQVLGEYRRSDEHEEPELVPGAGATSGGRSMSDWMRQSVGKYRSNGT